MHSYMEYGALRDADLVLLPLDGGPERILTSGKLGGKPGFAADPATVYIVAGDGLNAVPLQGGQRRRVIQVLGPGWYFAEGPAPVDDLKISPDGHWVLAQVAQQLHVVEVPPEGDAVVDLSDPAVRFRKLTTVGADFFDWADGGATITWAVGSTWYRRPFAEVKLLPAHSRERNADRPESDAAQEFTAVVEVPRDRPEGALLLSGATVVTMAEESGASGTSAGIIQDADLLVVNDRIAAIGPRGRVEVPVGTERRDVSGRYIVPGFIDTHDHVAEIRRGILDLQTWAPAASLAWGVTTKFDPSTLSIDMLAYEDLIDAGMITGARIHSTGTALFSFNEFQSKEQVVDVLKRYRDHYRTFNSKMYRTGNRRVRQWVAMAASELGMMPTAEGALALKLDLSQIVDGFVGQEHALPAAPLHDDIVTLMARSGVSYTTTLMITNGGPEGQDYFISRNDPVDDPKLNRFWPRYAIDIKMRQRTWRTLDDYFFPAVAASVARVQRTGGLIGMGAHGEVPGPGYHWEMQAHQMGGMKPLEILRAATIGAAATIGRAAEFGSLEAGKYADLVILDQDPLADIRNAQYVSEVMKNGRLYDAASLAEIWPRQVERERPWFLDDDPLPPPDQKTGIEEVLRAYAADNAYVTAE